MSLRDAFEYAGVEVIEEEQYAAHKVLPTHPHSDTAPYVEQLTREVGFVEQVIARVAKRTTKTLNTGSTQMFIDHIILAALEVSGEVTPLLNTESFFNREHSGHNSRHSGYRITYRQFDTVIVEAKPVPGAVASPLQQGLAQILGYLKASRIATERAEHLRTGITMAGAAKKFRHIPTYGVLTNAAEWVFCKYFYDEAVQGWRFVYAAPVSLALAVSTDLEKNLQAKQLRDIISCITAIVHAQVVNVDSVNGK